MRHLIQHAPTALFLLAAAPAFGAAPTITNFSPTLGPIGSTVVITGAAFTGAKAVTIGGVASIFTVKSATTISAYLPATATGPIAVTTAGGAATSTANFNVTPGAQASPVSMHPQGNITVTASGMDAYTAMDVYFDVTDEVLAVSNGSGIATVTFRLPANAAPGAHSITFDERSTHKAAQTPITVDTDWLQAGFAANNAGFNVFEGTLGSTTVSTLDLIWAKPNGGAGNHTPLVEQNGIIFSGDVYGVVRAYAATTGALVWTANPGGWLAQRTPVIYGGNIYFANATDLFAYKVNCGTKGATCKPVWTQALANTPNGGGGLSLFNGVLYATSSNGEVYPVNPTTGALGTPFYAYGNTYGAITSPVAFSADGSFAYAADGDTILAAFSDGGISSYQNFDGVSGVAFGGNLGFFESGDAVLHELNGHGWAATLANGSYCYPTPAVGYGTVFAGDCNAVYAYSAGNGMLIWESTGLGAVSGIVLANHIVYACAEYTIVALDETYGGLLWSGGFCSGAPIVANGSVYSDDGQIFAFTLPTLSPNVIRRAPSPSQLRPDLSLAAVRTPERAK
jgi:hypothetical protein